MIPVMTCSYQKLHCRVQTDYLTQRQFLFNHVKAVNQYSKVPRLLIIEEFSKLDKSIVNLMLASTWNNQKKLIYFPKLKLSIVLSFNRVL